MCTVSLQVLVRPRLVQAVLCLLVTMRAFIHIKRTPSASPAVHSTPTESRTALSPNSRAPPSQ